MLSLFSIWSSFQSLVNTSQNSFFRPQTDFQQACNDISKELFLMWTGQSEKSQEVRDFLSPFFISKNIIVKPQSSYYGKIDKPKLYERWGSARVFSIGKECVPCAEVDGGKCEGGEFKTQQQVNEEYYANIVEGEVDLVDDQRWAACLKHLTKKPTLDKPKMTQIDGGWKVAPRTVSVIVLDFYTKPVEGTFKYAIAPGNPQTGAGDYIVYDPSSVPLQWPETVINYFLVRLAQRYGIFISNQFLAQFAAQQKAA